MSQPRKLPFQLTLIAAAVFSLSACTTTNPTIGGVGIGDVGHGIGNGISKVGSKTAELGSSAWQGTKNVLNIGAPKSDELGDVDLALMDDEFASQGVQIASASGELLLPQSAQGEGPDNVIITPTASTDIEKKPLLGEKTQASDIKTVNGNGDIVVLANFAGDSPETEQLVDGALAANGSEILVPTNDLTHIVTESETLWVIAKSTTGDANNWHILADINDLAPTASVYPGQKLMIPADMVKPGYGEVDASAVTAEIAEPVVIAPAVADEAAPTVAAASPDNSADADATVVVAEQTTPANIMENATALKILEGETLWDFSKRTTGDATNWKSIAEKNLLTEKQISVIRPGQKVYVPTDMVRSRDANGVLIAIGEEGTIPTATAGGVTPTNQGAIDASTAALAANTDVKQGDIKIVEAAYTGDAATVAVTAESLADEAAAKVASADNLGKVMVRGTYYPKAVYNDADFSSSLLMRVSPGTELLVSKAVGPWLEVQTAEGVGYVHSRDIK